MGVPLVLKLTNKDRVEEAQVLRMTMAKVDIENTKKLKSKKGGLRASQHSKSTRRLQLAESTGE